MRARRAIIYDVRKMRIEEFNIKEDEIASDEALVETECSVVSAGTELANYTGLDEGVFTKDQWNSYPWIPGYGAVGKILAVDSRFTPSDGEHLAGFTQISVGDRVFYFGKHASHQQLRQRDFIAVVPDQLDSSVAVMARMALISITAVQVAEFSAGDPVVVLGLGLVGNLAAQLFSLSGAKVIGVDPAEGRRAITSRCGIEDVIGGTREQVLDAVRDLTGGSMARVVVDAVGDSRVVLQASELVAPFGDLVLLGIPRASYETNITPLLRKVAKSWVALKGALEWRTPLFSVRGSTFSYERNILYIFDQILSGKLIVKPLISHIISPDELQSAYEGLLEKKDEYCGVVVRWS